MSLNPRVTNWQGLRVWLVGASSGIGAALAHALVAAGASVIVSARSGPALVRDFAGRCQVIPLDVCDESACQQAHAEIITSGPLDYVIVCAADYQPMRAWELDTAALSRLIDINLKGNIHIVSAVLPVMLARGAGGIALTASVAGYVGLPKSLAYGPTKAALINFAEALYVDVHARGLAVHIINPGFVATKLTAGNDFKMPALITSEAAAQEILAGLARGEFEIHFPKRFTRWLKLLRHLPYSLKFKLLQKLAESS